MNNLKKEYQDDYELLYLISENNEDADEIIFKKYSPVISYYAKKYACLTDGKGLDYNDLYQEGMIGLNSAINDYREQKDIKFSTFAFMCIKRKIITAVKKANRKKHSILNESFSLDYKADEDGSTFDNAIFSQTESVEDLLVSKENEKYFKKRMKEEFSSFEKKVYDLKSNSFSNDEIAELLDKTYKSVESALNRIRLKLKDILDEIN